MFFRMFLAAATLLVLTLPAVAQEKSKNDAPVPASVPATLPPPTVPVDPLAPAPATSPVAADQRTLVYAARSLPAEVLTRTVRAVTGGSQVQIVSEPSSNIVIVRGAEETVGKMTELLHDIDQQKPMVNVEVHLIEVQRRPARASDEESERRPRRLDARGEGRLADDLSGPAAEVRERLRELDERGQIDVLNYFRLAAIDGQKVTAQVGERRPLVRSVAAFGGPRTARQIQMESIGTKLSLATRMAGDEIVCQIEFDKSFLGEEDGVPLTEPEGEEPGVRSVHSLVLQTSATVRPGHTVPIAVASDREPRNGRENSEMLLLLSADVSKNQ